MSRDSKASGGLRISWSFKTEDKVEAEEVLALLRDEDAIAHLEEKRGFLPGVEIVVAAAIGISALTSVIIRILRTKEYGVIIDARGPEVKIEKNRDLPKGTVTAISREGETVTTRDVPHDKLGDMIKEAVGA